MLLQIAMPVPMTAAKGALLLSPSPPRIASASLRLVE